MVLTALDLLSTNSQEIARFVVQDLTFLELSEPRPLQVMLQHFGTTQRKLWLFSFDPLFVLKGSVLWVLRHCLAILLHLIVQLVGR